VTGGTEDTAAGPEAAASAVGADDEWADELPDAFPEEFGDGPADERAGGQPWAIQRSSRRYSRESPVNR
jgi:hypothetical protein